MKRRLPAFAAILLSLLLVATGAWWWQSGRSQQRVAPLVPALPDLTGQPPLLEERLRTAEAQARGRRGARDGFVELVRLYHANGFLAEAMIGYAGLQQLEPDEPRWYHRHAVLLAGYGDLAAALPLWQKAVELAPDYIPARLRLGDALLKANRAAEAAAAYQAVLAREPANAYAELGLARLDLEAQRWEAARPRLEKVVSQTNSALGYDLIVTLYERLGLTARATALRATTKAAGAYRDAPDPWVDELIESCLEPYRLSLQAGVLGGLGDMSNARRLLERAVEVAPQDVSVRFQLGTLLVSQGALDEAHRQLERCTIIAPGFADAWAHLSSLQRQQGRTTAAEKTLAEGLQRCPESPGLHLMMARQHRQAQRLGPAIAEYRESARLRPNEAEAFLELGQLLIGAGQPDEGIAEIRRALAAEPGNPVALGILAFFAITTGDEAEANAWMARVRQQPRVQGEQLTRLVRAYQQRFGRAP